MLIVEEMILTLCIPLLDDVREHEKKIAKKEHDDCVKRRCTLDAILVLDAIEV